MEKGLHGLGLREAGLKQADLWEDWLCVLREPCGERGQEKVGMTLLAAPLRVLGVISYWLEGPAYLESGCQHFQGALPIGLSRRSSLRPEGQERRDCHRS